MPDDISLARRALAYWWYAWGLSWCYWGIRPAEPACFRAGIRSIDRSIRLWPDFAAGFYRRGLIRGRELSQHAQAIADLTHATELAPEWPEPYLQRGLFQRFHGDPRAALGDLQHYLELGGERDWRAEAERQVALLRAELDVDDA
jgi:tetratricopeptide (TPR) repeat protein